MSCRIITFYSYKGGTGRSMAVANTAWVLASNGLRVLVVDWDLEAPGLHQYFHPFLPDHELRSSPGVIDLVWEFATAAVDPGTPDEPGWHERLAAIRPYAMSVEHPFPGRGTIDLVPAGRQDHLYSTRVATFDWNNFYERLGGGGFLEALKRSMRADYDYVLIDSRTGFSDTAGICTVQFPDILVNCFALSTQAIDGAVAVAASVHRQRGRDQLRMFPVPMRVEDGELDKLEASRDYARARLGRYLSHLPDPDRYWGEVEVPYKSFYAYEEILAPIGDRPQQENTILAATERIVGYLTDQGVQALGATLDERERRSALVRFQRVRTRTGDGVPGPRPGPRGAAPARVFLTCPYDSAEHWDAVRDLWFLLRGGEVDARLDRPPGQRPEDWPLWQAEEMREADLVVAVSSPAYRRRPTDPDVERVRASYDVDPGRFLTVLLPGASDDDIPAFLLPGPAGPGRAAVELASLTPDGVRPLLHQVTARLRPPARPRERILAAQTPEPVFDSVEPELAEAADELALRLREQMMTYLRQRRIMEPYQLPVRWTASRAVPWKDSTSTRLSLAGESEDLVEIFLSLPHGRLVLLGGPGAGKTDAAILLATRLLARREASTTPVPVLLHWTSWNPETESLHDWITGQLQKQFPLLFASFGMRYARLVRTGGILPILDGLDELPLNVRALALRTLAEEVPRHGRYIVTSRVAEYMEVAGTSRSSMTGATVLEARSLSPGDVIEYLDSRGAPGRWEWLRRELQERPHGPVGQALVSPVMVRLAAEIYQDRSSASAELLSLDNPDAVRGHLLANLIPVTYGRAGDRYDRPLFPPVQAGRWLSFLARHMTLQATRDLAWWELHRALGAGRLAVLLGTVSAVITASVFLLLGRLPGAADEPLANGWLIGGATTAVALTTALSSRRSPLPSRFARAGPIRPEASLRVNRLLTLGSALAAGLVSGLAAGVWYGWDTGLSAALTGGLVTCGAVIMTSLLLALRGSAWLRYLLARIALASVGRLPWRLLRFLDEAHRRGVLRESGPVYQFRYAALQDLLAHRERT
ncbi:KGGVGR-motif variant AAA ATPase [Streptomyces sp. WAC05374]|uniref:KGGVGR-motif variant AAA ATPase n=1 Tax=Streptomyces sp. WAC05374 TaxID=2487420 RepID=UPI0021AFEE68|nr:hypothetical protein [Streptomyces sp. WAC05374]